MSNPLKPEATTLIKVGSLLIHYQEYNSSDCHALDKAAIDSLEKDPDVIQWIKEMTELALLPVKRKQP